MAFKPSLFASAALGLVCAIAAGQAQAAPKHHHHRKAEADAGLKAEVQQLREQVEALQSTIAAQQQAAQSTQAQVQQVQAQAQQAQAQAQEAADRVQAQKAAADAEIARIPTTIHAQVEEAKRNNDKLYYKGVTVQMGGFLEAAGIYRSRDETADIGSNYGKIPYANDRAAHTSELRGTARQSRYSLLVQGALNPNLLASFYGEFDFLGAAQTANSNESNSYQPRIRVLYGQLDTTSGWHLLAGQSWSLVTLTNNGITPRSELSPPVIEAQYVPGFVWARQPQIRLTKDFDKTVWLSVSAENPQTTFGNTGVASGVTITTNQAPTSQFFNGTNYSLNDIPDFVGKAAYEKNINGHVFHAEVFGLYRSYLDRVNIAPTATNQAGLLGLTAGTNNVHSSGGGVGGGVYVQVVPKVLDLQGTVLTGKGIGRYGSAQLPDVTTDASGKLQGIPATFWLVGGTLHATHALDVYVFGGEEAERAKTFSYAAIPGVGFGYGTLAGSNNSGCIVEGGSCSAVTKSVSQITAGFWDKFYQGRAGRAQFGLQYSYTEKKAFPDASGFAPTANENMVFASFRYYPF